MMKCDEVREILLTHKPFIDGYDPKVTAALEHCLKCSDCFYWSMKEAMRLEGEKTAEAAHSYPNNNKINERRVDG